MIPGRWKKRFFSVERVQIGYEVHTASCSMGTGGFSPGAERLGRE
jgi:hypothetical protein